MSKQKTPAQKTPGLTRRASGLMALEQRFMFDGAAVVDAVQTVSVDSDAAPRVPVALAQAERQAQQKIEQFLKTATDQQVFDLLHGDKSSPDAAWSERLAELREMLSQGDAPVQVLLMDKASQFNAVAAFAASGPDGKPTIFVSPYWAGLLGNEDMVGVIVEELGHWMDTVLNPGSDTEGDEGQRLANAVMGQETISTRADAATDSGWVQVDGVSYEVEFASFNFVNAYEMVYDRDNDTATGTIDGSDIDVSERWADKEQNLHYFNSSTSLGVVRIADGSNGQNFVGNDVSAIAVVVNGTTYYGWISRPIKANGVVRGFYFWTDDRFTTLAAAQADQNQDGDRSTLNNRGFVFVVDQTWFNQQITDTRGTSTVGINNQKDGQLGSIWVANVGSSSDRVDSALNSLLTPNSAPVPTNDSTTVIEDSIASGAGNTGNVLTNDADVNSDALTVSSFSVGTQSGILGAPLSIANVGTFTLLSNGNYTFVPVANYTGPVPVVTYSVTDGTASASATLVIGITPVNDAPSGADKSVTIAESTSYNFSASDFGFSDPIDTPANGFLAVKITTLPANGTLTLNGLAVTGGQTIGVSNLTQLRFTPAAGVSGSSYASFTFQVQDNGGTANGGVDLDPTPNTITLNVNAVNSAPLAVADATTVGEAGGVNNATNLTPTVSGDVLTNDSDADTGDTKTVTSVSGSNTGSVGASVAGRFGSLILNANGSYTYTVANDNPTVQALRLITDTLSDVFTYTVSDAAGLSSTTTLSITITGANDHPVALDDYNAVKEGATATNAVWGSATGNVLTNDSDVDGGSLVVESVSASVTTTTVNADVLTVTSPVASATYTVTQSGSGSWQASLSDTVYTVVTLGIGGSQIQRSDGNGALKVIRSGNGGNAVLIFDHPATLYQYASSTIFGFVGSGSTGFTIDSITPTLSSSSILEVTGGAIANVAVGDSVSGTGIGSGITVTAIDPARNQITLSQAVQISKRDITFTGPSTTTTATVTQTVAPGSSTTLTGDYGRLILQSNGSYTYELTSNALNDGQTHTESFTYTVNDSAGGSDTAVLNIRIDGRSAVTVVAANDSFAINEDATLSVTSVSGVLANDTAGSAVSSYTWGGMPGTVGSALSYTGFGTLTLNGNGSFIFVPDADFNGTVPPVLYTISNGAGRASATLSITVSGVNDAPAAAADTTEAREAGGFSNNLAGFDPTGNVLRNDTDMDGNALSVTTFGQGGNTGTVGQPLNGIYGRLTLNSDGSYAYVVNNSNALVQALAAGQTVSDVFSYTVSDGALSSSSTLTVTVRGANDAPVNSVPASQTVAEGATLSFNVANANALTVSDPEGNFAITATGGVVLSAGNGTLVASTNGTTTLAIDGSGTGVLTIRSIDGTTVPSKSEIDAVLATLVYTPTAGFYGSDLLRITTTDAAGLADVDTVGIVVTPDNRPLSVTGSTVNEASPYVMFQVTGAAGQMTTLTLGSTATTNDQDAIPRLDFIPTFEYFDGVSWQAYTGAPVTIPNTGTTLMVRVPVNQDLLNEGDETLTLTAMNRAGTASSSGVSTITDNGTGSIFLANNSTFIPSTSGTGFPDYLDDDRPVTVNSIIVNEASPWAMFTITGHANQVLSLALIDGTAKVGDGTPADGSEDYSPNLQYWNGSVWTNYNGTSVTLTGSTLLVRAAVHQDNLFEGQHTFALGVTKLSSNTTVYSTASIYDDGTGSIYAFDNLNDGTPTITTGPGAGFDDDRTVTIDSPLVNEASNFVVFTLTGNSGQTVSLQLQDESNNGAVSGKANILENQTLKVWNGLDWVDYDANNLPTFNAAGKIFVRVDIMAEQDTPHEGGETFKLNATLSGTTAVATGVATIMDDGTGVKFPGTFTNGTVNTVNTGLDDDRPVGLSVTGGRYNEGSPRAVFTVNATLGQALTLDVLDQHDTGFAPTGDNEGNPDDSLDTAPIFYSLDGGSSWQLYNGTPITAGSVPVLVAVDIGNESDAVYEGEEQFRLLVTSGNQTASAFGTIVDDGTGDVYPANATSPNANATKDDDRPLSVSSVTVNEGSPYAVFTVSGAANQMASLGLSGQNGDGANLSALQYFDGTAWQNYSSGTVALGSGGTLLVRVALGPEQETALDGPETFNLVATNTGGSAASGVGTIVDDGTGNYFAEGNSSATSNVPTGVTLDDDRPLTVSSVTVNEGSPYAVFTVSGAANQRASLGLSGQNGDGANLSALQYFDGTAWQDYSSGTVALGSGGTLLVRVALGPEQETALDGPETFNLVATNTGGSAASGVGTIVDDGTGNYFAEDNNSATSNVPAGVTLDDDRPLTVSSVTVNEGSPYAVFTVSGAANQRASLSLSGQNADGANLSALQYFDGTAWQNYSSGTVALGSGGTLLVRVALGPEQETALDGPETFNLVATNTGGSAASGVGTIVDDGTGNYFAEDNNSATSNVPAGVTLDDDRPKPAAPPLPSPPVLAPPAPPVLLPPPPPLAAPVQPFASALTPLAPALVPADPPLSLIDAVTSGSGYQIPVSETAPQGLNLYSGVTDQFVQTTGALTKISLPFDAFIHSNKDAVIKLEAKQADNSNLPAWVKFDPATGVFEVVPPPNFRGKLDLKVIARDDDGREAVAMFQMFVGEQQVQQRSQGRESFSDKLRMAAKRPVTLVRVADAPQGVAPSSVPVREPMPVRARAG